MTQKKDFSISTFMFMMLKRGTVIGDKRSYIGQPILFGQMIKFTGLKKEI